MNEPVERIEARDLLLVDLGRQLHELKLAVEKKGKTKERSWGRDVFVLVKAVLTGWPAFAILLLVLFHAPLRDALQIIPEKMRAANEFAVAGLSLKVAVQQEASRTDNPELSKTIPQLSAGALEYFLRLSKDSGDDLFRYTPADDKRYYEKIWVLNGDTMDRIRELEKLGMVQLIYDPAGVPPEGGRKVSVDEALAYRDSVVKKYPIQETSESAMRLVLTPIKPIPFGDLRPIRCELTELGIQAKEVILKAVSTQLARKPDAKATTR